MNGLLLVLKLAVELRLHRDGGDVHLVPGQSLQHLQLRALNVKAKIVHPAKK
jgi:hypothetical protein